jgi:acyl CoA:acetate/3-ketoacid CoA transferase beta subunit
VLTRDEIGRRGAQDVGAGMAVDPGIGMGGDIDLALAARSLVLLVTGRDWGGGPKLVRRCTSPPTAGLERVEVAPGVDGEEVRAARGAVLQVGPQRGVADAGADPAPATEGGRV